MNHVILDSGTRCHRGVRRQARKFFACRLQYNTVESHRRPWETYCKRHLLHAYRTYRRHSDEHHSFRT